MTNPGEKELKRTYVNFKVYQLGTNGKTLLQRIHCINRSTDLRTLVFHGQFFHWRCVMCRWLSPITLICFLRQKWWLRAGIIPFQGREKNCYCSAGHWIIFKCMVCRSAFMKTPQVNRMMWVSSYVWKSYQHNIVSVLPGHALKGTLFRGILFRFVLLYRSMERLLWWCRWTISDAGDI